MFNRLGLNNPNWFQNVLGSIPPLAPPCPPVGTSIPGIGEVGTVQADWVCRRGIDWFAKLIYDLVPDDVWDVPLKIPATILYYPINYFCMCMEAQAAIQDAAGDQLHRDLISRRLDAALSTRATQVTADALQAGLVALSGGVGVAETTVDRIRLKADQLSLDQGGASRSLVDFRDESVRAHIEENLAANDTVALFRTPAADGGMLELVRVFVRDTIDRNLAAGQLVFDALRELQRGDVAFSEGRFTEAYLSYRRAYQQAVRVGR